MSIEAIKIMLDALENHTAIKHPQQAYYRDMAIEAGRQAIADAEKQEPVAFDVTLTEEESEFLRDTIGVDDVSPIRLTVGDGHSGHGLYVSNADYQEEGSALIVNTHPQPKREWVGLTEQEHTQIAVEAGCMSADWVFYGALIERRVKEKNT